VKEEIDCLKDQLVEDTGQEDFSDWKIIYLLNYWTINCCL
jgi:hypothetical protein